MITLYYRGCEITFPNFEELRAFCIHNDLVCAYEGAWEALEDESEGRSAASTKIQG